MGWFSKRKRSAGRQRRGPLPVRLSLEMLEDRTLLSGNPIVTENLLAGTSQSQWDIQYGAGGGGGDPAIQGYATDISVNHGQTVSFKINDTARASYHLDIYRMGYYQGNGARLVATVGSSQTARTVQPNAFFDSTTGLVDAGNWS